MAESQSRRLAAILAADIAGYSSLMGADEARTVRDLKDHQAVVLPMVAERAGRVIDTAGDGILAEFASVVNAVECAIAIQKVMAERNAAIDPGRRMQFRIGINIGDIIYDEARIYGDGINVAARLESIAEPGGICVSGKVYEEINGRIAFSCEDIGAQQLKNIARPLHAYRIRLSGAGAASGDGIAAHDAPPLRERPSIAVLPFNNMNGGSEQDYFADGIAEDIITALSRMRWLFVIARNSSFAYKGKSVDVKQVGRELGVRYVLEGSVRKSGSKVRITAHVADAQTGSHVWAERYDRELADIFAVQDELTQNVVGAIEPTLRSSEIARVRTKQPQNLDAYDLYLRAMSEMYSFTEDGYRRAESHLRAAVAREPDYADAWATLADCLGRLTIAGWIENYGQGQAAAREAALRAAALDPQNGTALAAAAWALVVVCGQYDQGVEFAERALLLHPNSAEVQTQCGWVFAYNDEGERAVECLDAARRFSPIDPRAWTRSVATACAFFFLRRFDDSARWARHALGLNRSFAAGLRWLAASLAHLGQIEGAKATIAQLKVVQPNSSLTRSRNNTFRHEWMLDLYLDGLRKAGLPE